MSLVSMMPSPPKDLGLQSASHLTQWYLRLGPLASQKNLARCFLKTAWTPSPKRYTPIA